MILHLNGELNGVDSVHFLCFADPWPWDGCGFTVTVSQASTPASDVLQHTRPVSFWSDTHSSLIPLARSSWMPNTARPLFPQLSEPASLLAPLQRILPSLQCFSPFLTVLYLWASDHSGLPSSLSKYWNSKAITQSQGP